MVFDKGIPSLYEKDDFKDANQILNWITGEVSGEDTVEAVTDSMLDMMIAKQRHFAAFFYNKQNQKSLKTLGKNYLISRALISKCSKLIHENVDY